MSGHTTIHLQNCLDRLRQGEARAREELIACASERLNNLAEKMFRGDGRLNRWEQSADVAQGAMLRLWRALETVQPQSLRAIVRLAVVQIRREMIDLARHHFGPQGAAGFHQTAPPTPIEQAGSPPVHGDRGDITYEPTMIAAWAEFHEQAGKLPGEVGEVFDLVFYQGLTHAEAAALMGVSTKTIQRRWLEACVSLHEVLGDRLPGL